MVTVHMVKLETVYLETLSQDEAHAFANELYKRTGEIPSVWEYEREPVDHRKTKKKKRKQ